MKMTKRLTSAIPDTATGAIIPPLHLSTVFAMNTPSSQDGFQYGRVGNPTREILEKDIATLHNGQFAHVFSSGSSALTTLLCILKKGDRIICHNECYEGTSRILDDVFRKFGIVCVYIDLRNKDELEKELRKKPKFVLFETPTNPTLTILDIQKISLLAHQHKAMVIVDNTFANPILQKPLDQGADIVIESITKSLNGHDDVIGGLVATNNQQLSNKIKNLQITLGTCLAPFDCFLTIRGLKTLSIRIKQQQRTTVKIAEFLSNHSAVEKVFFPTIAQPELTKRQMNGPGFVISFLIKSAPEKFITSLQLIMIGHSLGGTETLIQQPATMMNLSFKMPVNFFRLSVGLESFTDLKNDLNHSLRTSKAFSE